MADNMKLVTKEYVDAIETDIKDSSVGQKTPNGGEIFSTYEGENANKALGEASSAFGQGTVAGGKGFKIIDTTKIDETRGTYVLNTVEGLEVGMEYNVRLKQAKSKCGKLLAIDNTTITVDGYPNIPLETDPSTQYSVENYLTIVGRPDLGDTVIGFFSTSFGENSIAQDRTTFVAGRDNLAIGQYATALGRGNTSSYAGFTAGARNSALGNFSIGIGENNSSRGSGSVAIGRNNNNRTQSYVYSLGYGCDISNNQEQGAVVVGRYNEPLDNAIFTVGRGASDTNRWNSFVIYRDGSAEIQSQGTTDKSIVQKQYVDNKATTLQNAISANETLIQQEIDERKGGDTSLQSNIDKKLDKVTVESNVTAAYVAQGAQQTTIPISIVPAVGNIACFNTNGNMSTNTPVEETDSANKKYVDDTVATQVSSVYKAKGSIADLSSLPTPDKAHEGFVYNIENEFTTTDKFVEGTGKTYPAGTNVVIVNTTGTTYKYDVLAGMVDLSNYVTNDTLTTGLNGKVDKSATENIVYSTGSSGAQSTTKYTSEPTQYTMMYRTAKGATSVGTPTVDSHATPKSYVDNADALKMNKSAFDYNDTTKTLTIDIF